MERRTKNHKEVLHSEACRGSKLRGDEICLLNAFEVILTDYHDAVSVRNIGDDERGSRIFSECGDGPSVRF